jgi:hypothetical protein
MSLGCSRTHQVNRAKPLYRNTPEQRQSDDCRRPYVRILVTPDVPAELVMWEEQATGNVVLFTDPERPPCLFLAHGDDLSGLGQGILPAPVLLVIRRDAAPLVVPLAGIGTVQWQLENEQG